MLNRHSSRFMRQRMGTGTKEIKKRLQEAIDTGEVLDIVYQGGSQPGTIKEISLISIKSGEFKQDALAHIR